MAQTHTTTPNTAAPDNDIQDFSTALLDHVPALRAYARGLAHDVTEADDLVQDCLLKAMEKNHLYKRGTNLRAWLLTILRNLFINGYRRRQTHGTPVTFDEHYHDAGGPAPFSARATRDQIEAAIRNLPPEQREVVVLIPMQGFSYEEVARITEVPLGTVRSRLSRARKALKKVLDSEPEPAPQPAEAAA